MNARVWCACVLFLCLGFHVFLVVVGVFCLVGCFWLLACVCDFVLRFWCLVLLFSVVGCRVCSQFCLSSDDATLYTAISISTPLPLPPSLSLQNYDNNEKEGGPTWSDAEGQLLKMSHMRCPGDMLGCIIR